MIQELVDEFQTLAAVCANTNFGNKVSVNRYNTAVDRMREISKEISKEVPSEGVDDFAKLLEVEENKINLWAAIHLLEFVPINKEIEIKALNVIEKASSENNAEACRYRVWLEEWNERRGNGRGK